MNKKILVWSVVFVIGLFAVGEIIKYQRSEIQRVEIDETSYNQGHNEGYIKGKTSFKSVGSTNEELLEAGFTQDEIDNHKIKKLEETIKMAIDAGFTEKEIIVEKDFKELERLKKSLNIGPIYVFPK